MNCPEVVEVMQRYLDNDLSEEEMEQMFKHIAVCPACAETFRMLKSLSRDLEDLPEVTPKFSLVDAIMPQLDEIDRSRQERSAAASDQDETVVPLGARKMRRQRLFSSTAGRTLLGTAAAAAVLFIAIWNNEPREMSSADMQLLTTSTESQDAESGVLSQQTDGGSGNSAAETSETERSMSDSSDDQQQSILTEPVPEQEAGDAPVASKKQEVPSSSSDPAINNATTQAPSESPESGATDEGQGTEDAAESSQESAADSGANSNESAPNAAEQRVPDVGIMSVPDASNEDAPAALETPEQPAVMDDQAAKVPAASDQLLGIQQMPAAAQKWLSADHLNLAMLTGSELVLYSVTNVETNDMKEVQRIPLKGEWVSGQWSADSKVFHYQLNQDGRIVKEKVAVTKSVSEQK